MEICDEEDDMWYEQNDVTGKREILPNKSVRNRSK